MNKSQLKRARESTPDDASEPRKKTSLFQVRPDVLIKTLQHKQRNGLYMKLSPSTAHKWIKVQVGKNIDTADNTTFKHINCVDGEREYHLKELAASQWKVTKHEEMVQEAEDTPEAAARCDYFSAKVVKLFKQAPDSYVIILDAQLRCATQLIADGIPANRIIVIEKDRESALQQKLLAARPNTKEAVNVFWIGEFKQPELGIETCILNNVFAKYNLVNSQVLNKTIAIYLDFCGRLPDSTRAILHKLPNLQLYGLTRGHRHNNMTAEQFPALSRFKSIRTFKMSQVLCIFFGKKKSIVCQQGDEDEIFAIDRIQAHGYRIDADGNAILQYQVKYLNFPDSEAQWEDATDVHADDEITIYKFACLKYPGVVDPVYYMDRVLKGVKFIM